MRDILLIRSAKAKVRHHYFPTLGMLAKLTTKNQLTLPKAITEAVGAETYFEVEARNGQIILTPVRVQRGDAVRAKLAELELSEQDIQDAVDWARQSPR
jgi:bifunctional DNA-binding transcriptional regulator/antitoxin component of YhaV-PrlF toxin-antitoxin module